MANALPTSTPTVHDARRFWRVVLAIIVPIPWLAKGVQYIVLEKDYDHSADPEFATT